MLQHFIDTYGYWAIIIGTFFEGETIAILGGIAAHFDMLDYKLVALSAFFGSLCGDQLWFFIGRWKGKAILESKPKWKDKVAKIEKMIERNATLVILSFRFLYGLRNPTPFIIGTSDIKTSKFVTLNIISAAIWALVMTGGGFYLGKGMHLIMARFKQIQLFLLAAVAIALLIYWLTVIRRKRNAGEKNTIN